jgi:hypothetical protein
MAVFDRRFCDFDRAQRRAVAGRHHFHFRTVVEATEVAGSGLNHLIRDYLVSPCVEESPVFGPVPDLTCPMPLLADPAWPFPGVELEPACPMVEPAPEEVEPTPDGVEPAPDGPVWACELEMPETIEMASVVAASSVEIRIVFSP